MKSDIIKYFQKSIEVKLSILNNEQLLESIEIACNMVISTLENGGKIIFAGNGGSAADSQHLAAEFVSRFMFNRPGLSSVALTTDTSIITAIGNDYGFDYLFKRQLEAIGNQNDLFIGISTSGNSPNIIEALKYCKEIGIDSIGMSGETGGQMNDLSKLLINVPSDKTSHIQESHITIGHIICMIAEQTIFNDYR